MARPSMAWHPSVALACVALGAGCTFINDYSAFTFDGAPGPGDSGTDSGRADAPDATPDVGPPPETCDAPCLTDAYIDFAADQGSDPLTWRYQAQTFADQLEYFDLVQGTHRDVDGWIGSPAPPAILRCDALSTTCTETSELLLEASADVGPALVTTVPTTGRYTVDVVTRPIGAARTELWVSRNSAADLIGRVDVDPVGARRATSVGFEAVAGDRIVVALRNPAGAADAIIGASVRVSTAAAPSTCAHVVTFDGDRSDACGGEDYAPNAASVLDALSPGPATYLGTAQTLTSSGSGSGMIAEGQAIERTGDFTTQLWVQVDFQSFVTNSVYQDWSGTQSKGINFSLEEPSGADVIEANFLYMDATNTAFDGVTCSGGECAGILSVSRPPNDQWFHLRLTRSGDTMRLCVDGFEVASTQIAPGADISAALSPKLGVNSGGSETHRLDGTVDDVRHFREALPCAPAP